MAGAYLAGLLHPLVEELGLASEGSEWTPASNGMFIPFEDGSSVQLFDDDDLCEAEIRRFALATSRAGARWETSSTRVRNALRPADDRDLWLGDAPVREEIEDRLGNDREAHRDLHVVDGGVCR